MIAITKGMVAISALMSAGIVTAYDMTGPRTAAATVSDRFPSANEMFAPVNLKRNTTVDRPVSTRKTDRLPIQNANCDTQQWPYIAQQCLVTADGQPPRTVARTVTIERRIGENTSELTRVQVTDLANR